MGDVVEDVVEDLVDMVVTVPGGADIAGAASGGAIHSTPVTLGSFKPFEEARAQAEEQAATGTWAGDEIEPTEEERAEAEAILGRPSRDEAAALMSSSTTREC